MDYWVFSKKDFSIIADLMVQTLLRKPDNSELSVIQLFQEALQAEYVEGKDSDGDEVKGLRISDIDLGNGKHLHEFFNKWDFENGVWKETIKQGFDLLKIFKKKIKRAGYIIDGSQNYGLYKGWPWGLRKFYRNKANLISSFDGVEKMLDEKSPSERFYIQKRYETSHYHSEKSSHPRIYDYDLKRELQLWRIPAGCSTGIIPNEHGRVACFVLKGKCRFESSRWDYGIFDDDKDATWKEMKSVEDLKIYDVGCTKSNIQREETQAPQTAWYKMTNTGKSDLLLYVIDDERSEHIPYAPLIGLSRHRMGTDGEGIRTLVAFHDCLLDCKYCLNPQCKTLGPQLKVKYMSAEQIVEVINKDELYYMATKGGITLGGGEPLLYYNFLKNKFFKYYGKRWHVTVETSLNVAPLFLQELAPFIDEYVVDIKDMNPEIYRKYTGKDNESVLYNLQWLVENGKADHIVARIPLIPRFNTEEDRTNSRRELEAMGISRFDLFTYKTNIKKQ